MPTVTDHKPKDPLRLLKERLATISDVSSAASVLAWDRQTYMPEGGVEGRAEQLATLARLAHEMLVSGEVGELLEAAGNQESGSEEAALLRLARRERGRATKLPTRLVEETSRAAALAEPAWMRARERSDWSLFAPHLEKILALKREEADHLSDGEHPYDAMLDLYEPGATTTGLSRMFDELKAGIVPLVRGIRVGPEEDREAPLRGDFEETRQEEFGRAVISRFGYDWSRGRQDRTVHPFCINFGGPGDVRITTRTDRDLLAIALFATCHEAGHGLYEQGVEPAYSRTPLAGGVSMGIHESQSRLWENLVARSRPFWSHFYPRLQAAFPGALEEKTETFYRAVNAVRASPIRTEADELTYNLHVLLRFELEVALFEDGLSVSDLPEAWNAKTQEYLGFTPQDDASGVLQDTHWAIGFFGYFPTYALGNVLSVQLYEAALEAHPEIPAEMERGEFGALLGWLRENIHRHGSRYDPDDLVERATGRPPETAPYLRYLRTKFGELYDL